MARKASLTLSDVAANNLIKEVKKRGCIWNPEDEDHNDRYHTTIAWAEISKALQLPEDVLKVKWKNLRDIFRRQLKKNRGRSLEEYRGTWRHFKSLWFLHRLEANGEEAATDEAANDEDNTSNVDDNDNVDDAAADSDFIKFEPPDLREDVEFYVDDREDPIPVKRRKMYSDDHYDTLFLNSLTPYFRELDPIRKLVVRNKIQDMLLNEIAAQTASGSIVNSVKKPSCRDKQ